MRKTASTIVTALGAVLLLSSCSGSGGTAKDVDYTSAQSIATALDKGGFACTDWERNTEVMGAREDGSCQHGDETVSVTTFQDSDQMAQVNDALKALASGVAVQGDAWQVSVADKAEAEQVQKILGGDVK